MEQRKSDEKSQQHVHTITQCLKDRQADRQTCRHADRQTDRLADSMTQQTELSDCGSVCYILALMHKALEAELSRQANHWMLEGWLENAEWRSGSLKALKCVCVCVV